VVRDGVGQKEYAGDWANDKKGGYGTHFSRNGDVYDGEWFEGKKSGWGRMTYADGAVYEVSEHCPIHREHSRYGCLGCGVWVGGWWLMIRSWRRFQSAVESGMFVATTWFRFRLGLYRPGTTPSTEGGYGASPLDLNVCGSRWL
jgi:hypothetical protein